MPILFALNILYFIHVIRLNIQCKPKIKCKISTRSQEITFRLYSQNWQWIQSNDDLVGHQSLQQVFFFFLLKNHNIFYQDLQVSKIYSMIFLTHTKVAILSLRTLIYCSSFQILNLVLYSQWILIFILLNWWFVSPKWTEIVTYSTYDHSN